jgi:hypothetical protein
MGDSPAMLIENILQQVYETQKSSEISSELLYSKFDSFLGALRGIQTGNCCARRHGEGGKECHSLSLLL